MGGPGNCLSSSEEVQQTKKHSPSTDQVLLTICGIAARPEVPTRAKISAPMPNKGNKPSSNSLGSSLQEMSKSFKGPAKQCQALGKQTRTSETGFPLLAARGILVHDCHATACCQDRQTKNMDPQGRPT